MTREPDVDGTREDPHVSAVECTPYKISHSHTEKREKKKRKREREEKTSVNANIFNIYISGPSDDTWRSISRVLCTGFSSRGHSQGEFRGPLWGLLVRCAADNRRLWLNFQGGGQLTLGAWGKFSW